jgi:para-nitrobenzyl esterase
MGNKVVCALAIAGLVAGLSTRLQADPLTVKTEQGKAHGKTLNDGKVKAFLGLPYAAPPVGDLRWKALIALRAMSLTT